MRRFLVNSRTLHHWQIKYPTSLTSYLRGKKLVTRLSPYEAYLWCFVGQSSANSSLILQRSNFFFHRNIIDIIPPRGSLIKLRSIFPIEWTIAIMNILKPINRFILILLLLLRLRYFLLPLLIKRGIILFEILCHKFVIVNNLFLGLMLLCLIFFKDLINIFWIEFYTTSHSFYPCLVHFMKISTNYFSYLEFKYTNILV